VSTLLARGFALAASKFAGTGWNVKEGMQNTANLTAAFRGMVGNPKRTIMWGGSMGGLMTLGMIEKFPGLYDGAIALCPPAAGTPRRFDLGLDIALAYAVAFGSTEFPWRPQWGTPGDIRDDVNYTTEVAPYLAGEGTLSQPRPDLKGRWEFIRRLNKIPIDSYYLGPPYGNFKAMNMSFAVGVRAELEHRAGGPVAGNLGRSYSLSQADIDEIQAMYNVDVKPFLAEMNTLKFAAAPNARNYVEHYVDPTGRITRPVITLHSSGDALAIPGHESEYFEVVKEAGRLDLLVQKYTNGPYHCAFTPAQDIAAVDAMMYWLDSGSRPDDSFFSAPGFVLGFDPGPWPW
jgi:pimeloyl-ACP methyl ester carboxylesterase